MSGQSDEQTAYMAANDTWLHHVLGGVVVDSKQELAIMGFIYLCIGSIVVVVLMFKEVIDK